MSFHEQRRRILRDLPRDGLRGAGTVEYTAVRVDRGSDADAWPTVLESTADGDLRIRVGDPVLWLSPSDYTYRFRYAIAGLTFRSGARS